MSALPAHASVVVIGGGIMGCSTLYHLAKTGITDAILLERNQLTSGTTWHSAAQVRALRSTQNLTDLIRYSIDLYSNLEIETGQATGWTNNGSLSIATSEDRLVHIRRQSALAEYFGVRTQSLSVDEAMEFWPHMNCDDVVGAVWSPDDGRVNPSDLCAALVKGAQSHGLAVFEHTAVVGIVTDRDTVRAVETDRGRVSCDAIALCTGLWSRETGEMAGAEVPVWPCEHFYFLTRPIAGFAAKLPTLSDHDSRLYIRDEGGGLLIGFFEPRGKAISPQSLGGKFAFQLLAEDWKHCEPMMINALHRLPALESAEIKMLLNGPESFTPDGAFLLGESADTKGLFLGCGMNSVGVATGGGAGMALAHCIEHGRMPMDLSEVDPKRFPTAFNSAEFLTERAPEVLGKHYEITYPGRQWSSGRNLQTSALHGLFGREQAHFGQVFGWERPLYFGKKAEPALTFGKPDWFENAALEVRTAHEGAAVFDLSAFGKIDVTGPDACKFLNRLCTSQIDRPEGRMVYTTMLNERGGIESDLTAIRLASDHYRLYAGASSLKKDLAWLRRNQRGDRVFLADRTSEMSVLGLMGPNAARIVNLAGAECLTGIRYFKSGKATVAGRPVLAVRISYVGEFGWEITCSTDHAAEIYATLRKLGARPAGLFAQTSMRIEKRFLAYGRELDSETSPLEAGLAFAVDWSKEFVGRSALAAQRKSGVRNRIVSIIFDDSDAMPLGDEPVLQAGNIVGKTTSAAFGFRINAPVALAKIDGNSALGDGMRVDANIAGEIFSGRVLNGPAYDPTGIRMKHG